MRRIKLRVIFSLDCYRSSSKNYVLENLPNVNLYLFRTFTKAKTEFTQNPLPSQFSIVRNFWTGCFGLTRNSRSNLTLGFWQLVYWIAFYQHNPLKKMFFNLLVRIFLYIIITHTTYHIWTNLELITLWLVQKLTFPVFSKKMSKK